MFEHISKIFLAGLFTFGVISVSDAADDTALQKKYWDNGKVRVVKKVNQLGDLEEVAYYRKDGTLEQHVKYDADDRKVEESYYDDNGKLRENADGWAAMRFVYEGGQLRWEDYYGADGKLKERKQYNAAGDLIAKQYVGDGSILPAEEYNPVPPITGYEDVSYYDSYGRSAGTTEIDRDVGPWDPFYDPDSALRETRGED